MFAYLPAIFATTCNYFYGESIDKFLGNQIALGLTVMLFMIPQLMHSEAKASAKSTGPFTTGPQPLPGAAAAVPLPRGSANITRECPMPPPWASGGESIDMTLTVCSLEAAVLSRVDLEEWDLRDLYDAVVAVQGDL